jgi:hypothetical protein
VIAEKVPRPAEAGEGGNLAPRACWSRAASTKAANPTRTSGGPTVWAGRSKTSGVGSVVHEANELAHQIVGSIKK